MENLKAMPQAQNNVKQQIDENLAKLQAGSPIFLVFSSSTSCSKVSI